MQLMHVQLLIQHRKTMQLEVVSILPSSRRFQYVKNMRADAYMLGYAQVIMLNNVLGLQNILATSMLSQPPQKGSQSPCCDTAPWTTVSRATSQLDTHRNDAGVSLPPAKFLQHPHTYTHILSTTPYVVYVELYHARPQARTHFHLQEQYRSISATCIYQLMITCMEVCMAAISIVIL